MKALAFGLALACTPAAAAVVPTVKVDSRLEIDGIFQLLIATSAPAGFTRPPPSVSTLFAAVGPVTVAPSTVPFFDRAQLLMRLGPLPELSGLESVPESVITATGGRSRVEPWLKNLRALAAKPAALAALKEEQLALAPAVEAFRTRLASGVFVEALEDYTGLPMPGPHRINLSAFHTAGAIANVVKDLPDGGVEVDSLFGPDWSTGEPDFWTTRVPGTLWHEQGHGVLDPLADLWAARIERAKPADASAICYGAWRQCVREHVVRAVMLRLMDRRLGPGAAAEQRRFEQPGGYRWLDAMETRLKEYESDRSRYPTLADFYPRLLDLFLPENIEDARPFEPREETSLVRARAARLAETALLRVKMAAVRRRLTRALSLAREPQVTEEEIPLRDPAALKAASEGISAFAAGRREEALALFDRALAVDPGYAEALLSRATVLEALGRGEDALAACAGAAAASRRRSGAYQPRVLVDALLSQARLLLARPGRESQASAALLEALAAAPADWPGKAEAAALKARLKLP